MVNFLRNFLSLIIISIFSLALSSALFTFDLKDTFLNSTSLKKVLVSGKVYEHLVKDFLPSFLSNQLSKDKDNPTVPTPLLKSLAEKVIPPAALQSDTERVIDSVIPYLNSKDDKLNVTIDLKAYKKRFNDNLKPTLTDYLTTLAVCEPGKEPTNLEKIPTCRPKDLDAEQISQALPITDIQSSLEKLPNSLIINESGFDFQPKDASQPTKSQNNENGFKLKNVQNAVGLINLVIVGSLIVSLLSLLLLLLTWINKLRRGLEKIAYAILSTAFLPAVVGGSLLLAINQELLNSLNVRLSNEIVKPFFDHLGTLLLLQAGGLVIIGIVILGSLRIFLKEKEVSAQKSS